MTISWIDRSAAQRRFAQIDLETHRLEAERNLIQSILDTTSVNPRPAAARRPRVRSLPSPVSAPVAPQGRPASVSLVDLIADALRFAPSAGLAVADIVRHIARNHPDRASAPSASLLVAAAAAQASRAKKPRIKVVQQAAKGAPVRYRAA